MILSIETSTNVCSVALHKQGQLIAHLVSNEAYSHAEKLAIMIDELLKMAKIPRNELAAVAVSAGPGSYTGLRIGTSTAKGICYALDIPLIAIGTLESMLEGLELNKDIDLLCPMIDARRMEVYCLLAKIDGLVIETTQAKIIDQFSYEEHLNASKIAFYGNGAEKCKSVLTHRNATFIDNINPSAIHIGKLAEARYKAAEFADLVYFEPEYLKAYHAIKAKNPLL